ncbi:restriction endonuclease subunit S [Mycoplasmopsis gallinarum]
MPKTPKFIQSGIPFITSKNLKNNEIDFKNVSYISLETYQEISANRKIEQGDILISMIGTIGDTAIVKINSDFYGQNMYLLRFDNELINKKYFQHFFYTSNIKNHINRIKTNSNQSYLKNSDILDLNIYLPDLKIQNKIVEVLDNFETICKDLNIGLPAEIEKRQHQYEFYRDQIFYYLENNALDNRLREREREEISKLLSYIFNSWKVKLANIASFSLGKYIEPQNLNDNFEYPYMNAGINKIGNYNDVNQKANITIMSTRGASTGYIQWMGEPFWQGNNCLAINVNNPKVNSKYLYFYLKSKQEFIYSLANQSSVKSLEKNALANIDIILPDMYRQNRIVDILNTFESISQNMNIGLPAEINLREKQYQYYLNRIFEILDINS